MWAGIERATRAGSDRAPVRRLTVMRLVWGSVSVAAAVLVLVLVPRVLSPASGQLVASAAQEQGTFETADGSTVVLRPHSSLFQVDDQTYRLEGEAFFDVTHNPDRVFAVATEAGTVQVLGTRFNVAAIGEQTSVYLESGRVRFDTGEEARELVPGQQLAHRSGTPLSDPEASDGLEETDWIRGELSFDSRPAGSIASELARHYQIRIDLPGTLRGESMSGTLLLQSQAQALEDFGLVLGGRFVPSGNGVRFIEQ